MRLTVALLKESYRWRLKQLWKTKGMVYPLTTRQPLYVKKQVEEGGLKVETGAEYLKDPPKFSRWEPPIKDDPQYLPPRTIKDHPDYQEEWVYEFAPQTRLSEGVEQALLLTKTQPFYGLPKGVLDLVGTCSLPDQDTLMQRAIMQSNVWDPSRNKLPRRVNPDLPIWKFKAEFGVTKERIASTMIRNIIQLSEMALCRSISSALGNRRTIFDPTIDTFYYHAGKHVAILAQGDAMICSRNPLPAFADESTIDSTTSFKLPDIYPLLPTIDLQRRHIWRSENQPGFAPEFSHPHMHTLYSMFDDTWTTEQQNAKALMFCFGMALSSAKQRFGDGVKKLDKPISTACVLTNGSRFSLTCFQLNTLDISGTAADSMGVKNLVWFEAENDMYNKIVPKRSMLRNTRYEDYDAEVLRKLFALNVYGLQSDLIPAELNTKFNEKSVAC